MQDTTLSLKTDAATAARVDALVTAIQARSPAVTVRRSDALRAALAAGLPLVESTYGVSGEPAGPTRAKKER